MRIKRKKLMRKSTQDFISALHEDLDPKLLKDPEVQEYLDKSMVYVEEVDAFLATSKDLFWSKENKKRLGRDMFHDRAVVMSGRSDMHFGAVDVSFDEIEKEFIGWALDAEDFSHMVSLAFKKKKKALPKDFGRLVFEVITNYSGEHVGLHIYCSDGAGGYSSFITAVYKHKSDKISEKTLKNAEKKARESGKRNAKAKVKV